MGNFIGRTKDLTDSIFQDYKEALSDMYARKSSAIFYQRIGPIVRRITLDFGIIETYRVRLSLSCLLNKNIPFISQELLTDRNSVQDSQQYRFHTIKYKEAIERLRRQSLLPFKDNIKLSDVFKAYDIWENDHRYWIVPYHFTEYTHLISLLVWAGKHELAMEAFELFSDKIRSWPEERISFFLGTVDNWREKQLEYINEPQRLIQTEEENIKRFKLTNVPNLGLTIDDINLKDYKTFDLRIKHW